jgi:hypothetical protein
VKALVVRTLYRVLITLVLFVGFVLVGISIPLDIALTILKSLSHFVWYLYEELRDDFREIRFEATRVLRAFAEAFRRGKP